MFIKSIKFNTTSSFGFEKNLFNFSNGFNLLDSNGINSRGKTSLIKFIIWGLGYDISFTGTFNRKSSEVKLLLLNNKKFIYTDRIYNKIKIRIDDIIKSFNLPEQESECIQYLFGFNNVYLNDQLIGLFYFDQDQGLREWNRGKVVQSLGPDKSYYLSIEQILFGLIGLNYKKYHSRELKLNREQEHIGRLINSITPFINGKGSIDSFNFNKAQELNNDIYKIDTLLQRLNKFYHIYTGSRRKEKKIFKLLNVIDLYVENPNPKGNPIHVDKSTIIKNNFRDLQLSYISNSYKLKMNDMGKKLKKLKYERNSLVHLRTDYKNSSDDKDYLNAKKEVALSGLDIRHLKDNRKRLNIKRKTLHKRIYNIIKNSKYYNKMWNTAHGLSQGLVISNYFSIKKNKILYKSISYSGAKRSLIIFVYRLAMYLTVMRYLNINLPIILDSPGSQEMDQENLNELLNMIKNKFPNTQIIVATNSRINVPHYTISLNKGVFGNL